MIKKRINAVILLLFSCICMIAYAGPIDPALLGNYNSYDNDCRLALENRYKIRNTCYHAYEDVTNNSEIEGNSASGGNAYSTSTGYGAKWRMIDLTSRVKRNSIEYIGIITSAAAGKKVTISGRNDGGNWNTLATIEIKTNKDTYCYIDYSKLVDPYQSYTYILAEMDGTPNQSGSLKGLILYHMDQGIRQLGNDSYNFNSVGYMSISKWEQIDTYWYYFDKEGHMVKDWQTINGKKYYFYSDGKLATNTVIDGWIIDPDGVAYKPINITSLTTSVDSPQVLGSKITITAQATGGSNSLSYKFSVSSGPSPGIIKNYSYSNICTWSPKVCGDYTLRVDVIDNLGAVTSKEINYQITDTNTQGWKQINGKWYYFRSDGTQVVSTWFQIENKWYYFDSSGVMQTGWVQVSNKWYYLYTNGAMAANTVIDGWSIGSDGSAIALNPTDTDPRNSGTVSEVGSPIVTGDTTETSITIKTDTDTQTDTTTQADTTTN